MNGIHEHDTKRLDKLMEKGALEQWAAIQIRNLAEQRIKDTGKIERITDLEAVIRTLRGDIAVLYEALANSEVAK